MPSLVVRRTGTMGVAPATPRPPMPFPSIALISPAMNVPWPTESVTVAPPLWMSTPAPTRPLRSGWVTSTPLSSTATPTLDPPPIATMPPPP